MSKENSIAAVLVPVAATVLLLTGFAAKASAADLTPSQCKARHLLGDGKYVKGLFKCWSKAAAKGVPVDTSCMNKTFGSSATYVWTNTGYGCTGSPDLSAAVARRIEDRSAVPLYDDQSYVADRCASKKLKALGKYAWSVQKAASKLAKTDSAYPGKYTDAREGAARKFADEFAKADSSGLCASTGDAAETQARIDADLEVYFYCDFELSDGNGRQCMGTRGGTWMSLSKFDPQWGGLNGWDPATALSIFELPSVPNTHAGHHFAFITPLLPSSETVGGLYVDLGEQVYLGLNQDYITEAVEIELRSVSGGFGGHSTIALYEGTQIANCAGSSPRPDPCVESTNPATNGVTISTSRNGMYQLAVFPF